MASNSHKFYRPDFVARNIPSISAGLFASNGKVHARQKRMIGPAFTSKYLKGFLGIFKENVDNLVKVSDSAKIYSQQVNRLLILIINGHFVSRFF